MASSQFRIFTSADTNAPQLYGVSGSLLPVLDFCLVTGSGWTKPIANTICTSSSTTASLGCWQQPYVSSSKCVLFINDSIPYSSSLASNKEAWAVGWETITSLTSSAGTGSAGYVQSASIGYGFGQFPLASQGFTAELSNGHVVVRKSNTADVTIPRPWLMFADSSSFYFFVSTNDLASAYTALFFGDIFSLNPSIDISRCIISARNKDSIASATTADPTDTIVYATTTTGLLIGLSVISRGSGGRTGAVWFGKMGDMGKTGAIGVAQAWNPMVGVPPCPNPSDNTIYLSPVWVWEIAGGGGNIRGRMRGLYHVCHPLASFIDGQNFGGTGDYAGKTFQIVKQGANGGFWAIETSNTVETN